MHKAWQFREVKTGHYCLQTESENVNDVEICDSEYSSVGWTIELIDPIAKFEVSSYDLGNAKVDRDVAILNKAEVTNTQDEVQDLSYSHTESFFSAYTYLGYGFRIEAPLESYGINVEDGHVHMSG